MRVSNDWKEYELLDATCGARLERWGTFVLERPDPQVIWKTEKRHPRWKNPDASYRRDSGGGGVWQKYNLPEQWEIGYKDYSFIVRPMNFKHMGLFPEQACNWDSAAELIKRHNQPVKLLNLFAYTGAASVVCAKAGASVTHVDAAKGMVAWAKQNAEQNGADIRRIVDDCKGFIEREIRRGNRYDAIIMDPPSYGRGPNGEIWRLEDDLYDFLTLTARLLSDDCAFVFINSYTTGLAPSVLQYLLAEILSPRFGGKASADEIGLTVTSTGRVLPSGATGQWIHY